MRVREILENRTKWIPNANYEAITPVVSVLLPTWKRAASGLFETAVRSVLDQTLQELELIIVDDCSTDGTFEIIQRTMQEDSRVNCIRHTANIGLPAISEFEAFQKSRGTYLAFIFDDNVWELDALKQLVAYAQQYDVKALAGQYMLFAGRPGCSYSDPKNWSVIGGKHVNISDLMVSNCFGNGSVLLHRSVIETVGFLDPNVALSRLWDWDLWQRISKKFRFEMVDIMVGKEKGTGLEDSLGNTHQLYQWAAQERMHQPRDQELTPEHYLDCDVFEFSLPSSSFLYRSNCWIAKQYENKVWFESKDASLDSIRKKSTESWNGKRIVYLTASPQVNASSTLNWGRLPYSADYVIYFSCICYYDYYNWILADAIIIERDLSGSVDRILDWAKVMGIPCYYYVDDNFTILAKDYENTYLRDSMQSLAKGTTAKHLNLFHGVFCSTVALEEYFISQKLHKKTALIKPIYAQEYVQPYHPLDKSVNIAFFGSFIRGELLIDIVYPALERISSEYDLHLYCPEETYRNFVETLYKKGTAINRHVERDKSATLPEEISVQEHLTLHSFPRTLSLELALKRLAEKRIQIQIHCGPMIENNRYKTVNALLNAVCLGAVLIATDDHPYSDAQIGHQTCLLAENTVDAWENALRKAMDPELHSKIYQSALAYCQKEFDALNGLGRLVAALSDVESYDIIDLNQRLLRYIQYQNNLIGYMSSTTAPIISETYEQQNFSVALFLKALPTWQMIRTLRALLPGWSPRGRGIERLLPMQLSHPLESGAYIESRLPKAEYISLVLVSSGPCQVLFEFVAGNRIICQEGRRVNGIQRVMLSVPASSDPVRLRIANNYRNVNLYVLQRHLLLKQLFETSIERERCIADE